MNHCLWEPTGDLGPRLAAIRRVHVERRRPFVPGLRNHLVTDGSICHRVRSRRWVLNGRKPRLWGLIPYRPAELQSLHQW